MSGTWGGPDDFDEVVPALDGVEEQQFQDLDVPALDLMPGAGALFPLSRGGWSTPRGSYIHANPACDELPAEHVETFLAGGSRAQVRELTAAEAFSLYRLPCLACWPGCDPSDYASLREAFDAVLRDVGASRALSSLAGPSGVDIDDAFADRWLSDAETAAVELYRRHCHEEAMVAGGMRWRQCADCGHQVAWPADAEQPACGSCTTPTNSFW
jgi:hypothetical protein